ncbi:MAG TPA: tRNA lysidine(34) synthetase TilS [Acidimicrobiales bacterium]|nr:tRNA lysidine(34) synthetase TilS [Acidimicrobiales bacterium]
MTGRAGRSPAHANHDETSPEGPEGPEGTELDPFRLLELCTFPEPGSDLVCAVSGGPDSLALLVLAVEAGCNVTAVHVDHGLRPGSGSEADVVAQAARRCGAEFRAERVEVEPGGNLEARARAARRAAVGEEAATGHTMDDQAETVMVNLLRGAGLDGLAGMRHGTQHPLLSLRRSDTRALCRNVGLEPVEDPSNLDMRFVRNRVRHELLPLCSEIAGRDVVPLLARQAGILQAEAELLDALASDIDASDARALRSAPTALARRATRRWLRSDGYPPDLAAVERVLAVARGEAPATDLAPGRRVRRSRGTLASVPVEPIAPSDLR